MVEFITPQSPESPVDYLAACAFMDARVEAIYNGTADECVWLLEHPALYTRTRRTDASAFLRPPDLPVYETKRGGELTYHGPGQRVVYVMLDLRKRGRDIRGFVHRLAQWLICVFADFGVAAYLDPQRIGVWVTPPDTPPAKLAAIGIAMRRWISLHGVALNIAPDLTHYEGIIPCGISDGGITSLASLDKQTLMHDIDAALIRHFNEIFD